MVLVARFDIQHVFIYTEDWGFEEMCHAFRWWQCSFVFVAVMICCRIGDHHVVVVVPRVLYNALHSGGCACSLVFVVAGEVLWWWCQGLVKCMSWVGATVPWLLLL
jgi:uncharacterized membrane protein